MSKHISLGLVAALLCGVASAASSPDAVTPSTTKTVTPAPSIRSSSKISTHKSESATKKAKVQVGTASWYGKQFHGRLTANGETYDMFQFTAAHRTLPLGTLVKVTNLRNGKWVVVKVNDRGPYVGHRVMDVSYGAAQMMGFRQRGIEKVRLEVIEPETIQIAQATP